MTVVKSFAQIQLPSDPAGVLQAGTKQYIDAGDAASQPLDSDLTIIAGLTATTNNMIMSVSSAWASRTPAQVKSALAIAESDVTNLVTDLAAKAPTASPTFTGTATFAKMVQTPVTLTDAATVAVDASLGNTFRLTMTSGIGSTRALGNPTNSTDGQMILIEVIQDGTGSRLLTYGTNYAFGTLVVSPTLTTTASKTDFLGFMYNSTAGKWRLLAFAPGY
jgi:hypothetical protein